MESAVCMRESHPGKLVLHQQAMDWKLWMFAFGSVFLTILLIGASAAADVQVQSPESGATAGLPGAKPGSDAAVVSAPSSGVGQPEFISPEVIERARQRIRARAALEHLRSGSARAEIGRAAINAKLPLPNAVIARTIERIGYACGTVASITTLEGDQAGVYKVTCTSGQSYQARPVHGRYHFRRW